MFKRKKIKIFNNYEDPTLLEFNINQFLNKNKLIDIKLSTNETVVIHNGEGNKTIIYEAIVIYE